MCKKLTHWACFALVLALLGGKTATADLIAHWPLDGNYLDATGNGHDGTPLDDPKFVVDGEKGLVLEVDGSARVMVEDAPDLNFTASESLTMTVWVLYDPSLASSGWRSPCGKGRTAPGGDTSYLDTMYGFFVSPDNEWASNMGSLGGGVGPAVDDEWHHFAFVQDGDRNENFYYINLEVVQSGGAADCSTPGRPFFIGASGSDTSPFEGFGGRISEVRIYNEALAGDALAATTSPLARQTEILITFSDLDQEGEVPVAEDYQPSELDGTGITTTWTGMQQFNDDIAGEGLRDHTVTWDQAATSVYVYTENEGSIAFNTEVEVPSIWILQDSWAATALAGHLGGQELWSVPADHPEEWIEITEGAGHKIDSIVAVGGYSRIDDITIGLGVSYSATDPSPADEATDVPLDDVFLSWESGKYAATHNIYFGTSASAVGGATVTNPRDVLLIEGHDSNSYDPDVILDLGQTYFWRVDEVNAAPDYTVHRGTVWSFTAEPVAYPIADVTAAASSSAAGQGPENTVNGSGLDANDLH
ncbi:MAG: LamG-like jellyroll fold domain-containing protein, partial [Planctomycetota bacterium]